MIFQEYIDPCIFLKPLVIIKFIGGVIPLPSILKWSKTELAENYLLDHLYDVEVPKGPS